MTSPHEMHVKKLLIYFTRALRKIRKNKEISGTTLNHFT